jgi:hypothetical protein
MDNLNSPAYPTLDSYEGGGTMTASNGFTKLEYASLLIAQGIVQSWGSASYGHEAEIARNARAVAEAVLEEANK